MTLNKKGTLPGLKQKFFVGVIEQEIREEGVIIIGTDEVGRGPLAGPVVTAAVRLPKHFNSVGINDSKKLTAKKRELLFKHILNHPDTWVVTSQREAAFIDGSNILKASLIAMANSVQKLIDIHKVDPKQVLVLVDGKQKIPSLLRQRAIIKGDSLSLSIAAASIIAKVTRDRIMERYHKRWSQYGFQKHKGYGTQYHLKQLKIHGPCPIHRFSFKGVNV